MKFFSIIISPIFISVILFIISIPNFCSAEHNKSITILFTHDLHDHFYPFNEKKDGKIESLGGYARLYNAIEKERTKDSQLLLVDAGDFSMGTLFQTIFASQAPQLRIMGQMGYDVLTLGNHEFDFKPDALADSLNIAKINEEILPKIVASNISFPLDINGELSTSLKKLKKSMENYDVKNYTILKRKDIKIGIFGLMGKNAAYTTPMSEVVFTNYIEKSKEIVDILKNKEQVDLILCLSHSGTSKYKYKSENEILAKKVPAIDIIISGHSHTVLEEPIVSNNTIIASCGKYGENLGIIKIHQKSDKTWTLKNYRLLQIDDNIDKDKNISQSIESYQKIIQKEYLNQFHMNFDEVLANTSFDFTPASALGKKQKENRFANLIGDSYIYAVKKAEANNYEPITATIIPAGTIRDSFTKGNITVSNVFTAFSLGIGPDNISGYPLVSAYITGKELKMTVEFDASIGPLVKVAQLYISGLNYSFNPNRLIFNKVINVNIKNSNGTKEKIEDDKLYRVVTSLYTAQMLSLIKNKSLGLLSIVPKTKNGIPIEDYEKHIIYDNDHELKEWLAITKYLKSFNKINHIPQIPVYYSQTQGRKIIENDFNIIALIKKPNKMAFTIYAIIIILTIALIYLN